MKPFWTDGETSWYRVHLVDRNYSVKASEDPFGEIQILEIKSEWSGGRSASQKLAAGDLYDNVAAVFLAAKRNAQ